MCLTLIIISMGCVNIDTIVSTSNTFHLISTPSRELDVSHSISEFLTLNDLTIPNIYLIVDKHSIYFITMCLITFSIFQKCRHGQVKQFLYLCGFFFHQNICSDFFYVWRTPSPRKKTQPKYNKKLKENKTRRWIIRHNAPSIHVSLYSQNSKSIA